MKKAIVIGATSGIGRGIAKILADNGYKVGITGRRIELLQELNDKNPDQFCFQSFDICDSDKTVLKLNELIHELGGLDLLIISSGTGDLNKNLDFGIERHTIETNVIGFTAVADWAFNYFGKQQYGHLVGISSIGGLRGGRQAPSYNATKAYQINYLEALRQKAFHLKIPVTVTDIRPGFVDTDMAKGEGKFWVASVEKAALQIYKVIKRKKKVAYITRRWGIIALLFKVMPRSIYERL